MRKTAARKIDRRYKSATNKPKSGRKSRAEEFQLIERLDEVINPQEVMEKWKDLIEAGNLKAIEMYNHYRYGKPVERQIQITQNLNDTVIDMNSWK